MRLSANLLLPTFVGLVSAVSDATVYIFQDGRSGSLDGPTLTPEQARLIFAQRLGVSKYHGLRTTSEDTLSYITEFGRRTPTLFEDSSKADLPELLLVVEGVSSQIADSLSRAWSAFNPAFSISEPPSMTANKNLLLDLQRQSGQAGVDCSLAKSIDLNNDTCGQASSKIVHLDLVGKISAIEELMAVENHLTEHAASGRMNTVVVLMPESSRLSKSAKYSYGSYETVQQPIGRRQEAEEPMTEEAPFSPAYSVKPLQSSAADNTPITGVPPLCHSSLEACSTSTRNCSGHGECLKKFGGENPCFTCACKATNETVTWAKGSKKGWTRVDWGGSACHKRDVSSAFWLIAVFTIVMVGIVSWGIGLLFSIGEEKLPGVIGAGVSSKSR